MTRMNDKQAPQLSVVIIGRNEGPRLLRCLDSVRAMSRREEEMEIIYVDSASTDDSVKTALERGARVIELRADRTTAAMGRNAGWRAARGEFVLFLDGDTILAPYFVANSLPAMSDPSIAIVWGHRREIDPGGSIFNRVLDLDWVFPPGESEYCGGDALIRRSVLEEVGGFDETLIAGEEPEMCRRIRERGYRILHTDEPMTGHDLAMTKFSQYWRRAVRAGYAFAQIAHRSRYDEIPLWTNEVRGNLQRGGLLLVLTLAGAVASVFAASPWPLALYILIIALLSIRTAIRTAWKADDFATRLMYGAHSHFQQVPILFGQLLFWRDRWIGRRRGLIEYK